MSKALSEQQIKALQVLSKKGTYEEAAIASKVSRRTVIRWAKLPEFKEQLASFSQARLEVVSEVLKKHEQCSVEELVPKALNAVQTILNNGESRNADLLRAAEIIGKWSGLGQVQTQAEISSPDSLKKYLEYLASKDNDKNNLS